MKLLYLHNVPVQAQVANIIQVLQMCQAFQKIGVDVTLALPTLEKKYSEDTLVRQIQEKIGFNPLFRVKAFKHLTVRGFAKGVGASIGAASLIKQAENFDILFT